MLNNNFPGATPIKTFTRVTDVNKLGYNAGYTLACVANRSVVCQNNCFSTSTSIVQICYLNMLSKWPLFVLTKIIPLWWYISFCVILHSSLSCMRPLNPLFAYPPFFLSPFQLLPGPFQIKGLIFCCTSIIEKTDFSNQCWSHFGCQHTINTCAGVFYDNNFTSITDIFFYESFLTPKL
jgi:hypothetical protein